MSYYGPLFTKVKSHEGDYYSLYDDKLLKTIEVVLNESEGGLECIECESFKCDHVKFLWIDERRENEFRKMNFLNPLLYKVCDIHCKCDICEGKIISKDG